MAIEIDISDQFIRKLETALEAVNRSCTFNEFKQKFEEAYRCNVLYHDNDVFSIGGVVSFHDEKFLTLLRLKYE